MKNKEYLLQPFIAKGQPTILYGDAFSAQSLIATIMGVTVATSWADSPIASGVLPPPVNVLYLDWEVDRIYFLLECQRIYNEGDASFPSIYYKECCQPLSKDNWEIREIFDTVLSCNIGLVIINSLGMATGGDCSNVNNLLSCCAVINSMGISSLIVANTRRKEYRLPYLNFLISAMPVLSDWRVDSKQSSKYIDEVNITLTQVQTTPNTELYEPVSLTINTTFESEKIIIKKENK